MLTGVKNTRINEIWESKHAVCMKKSEENSFLLQGYRICSIQKKHGCPDIQIPFPTSFSLYWCNNTADALCWKVRISTFNMFSHVWRRNMWQKLNLTDSHLLFTHLLAWPQNYDAHIRTHERRCALTVDTHAHTRKATAVSAFRSGANHLSLD